MMRLWRRKATVNRVSIPSTLLPASNSNIRSKIETACWIWLSLLLLWAFLMSRHRGHGVYAHLRNGIGFECCFKPEAVYVAAIDGYASWSRMGYSYSEWRLGDWEDLIRYGDNPYPHWTGFQSRLERDRLILRLPWWAVLLTPIAVTGVLSWSNARREKAVSIEAAPASLGRIDDTSILNYRAPDRLERTHRCLSMVIRSMAFLSCALLGYDVFGGEWRLDLPPWAFLIQITAAWLVVLFLLISKALALRTAWWPLAMGMASMVVPWLIPRLNR